MPFIGRDWRSPGEAWVKTESLGWQRMKIIESQLYPSACHQNPACSWPPRSEFGQHMANNCNNNRQNDNSNRNNRNSSEFRDSISSAGSSDSGRGSSMSPSPTGSPEKNSHHMHPITISSPYGKYSCCSHHFEPGWLPSRTTCNCNYYELKTDNSHRLNAQTKSRSLSRESVIVDKQTNTNNQKIRNNNSVADFRNSSTASPSTSNDNNHQFNLKENSTSRENSTDKTEIHSSNQNNTNDNANVNHGSPATPTLMKNGFKIDDSELIGEVSSCVQQQQENTPATDNDMTNDKQKQQIHQPTVTTCCCWSNSQGIQAFCQPKEPSVRTAPHCRISVRTREVAMYNTISEAFYRLDFCNAIHDIRRFNYICKLLHLLITQNLTSLSGCATKVLFTMLEQVAWEVSSNKRNIHVLKDLLNELKQMIQKYYCWGRPIGSRLLWQQHFDTIERISQIVDGIELSPPKSDVSQITFNNLPVEMIREILLRLNDYRDLVNSAQASPVMRNMIDGQYIWQQLCRYHFTEQQLKLALDDNSRLCVKRGNLRGLKYARTTSADGRTSFRNPVTRKSKDTPTTRQQIEQTSARRGSRQKQDCTKDEPSSSSSSSSSSSTHSYVTRTIKIFDKKDSSPSATSNSTSIKKSEVQDNLKRSKQQIGCARDSRPSNGVVQANDNQQSYNSNSRRPLNHEIDWERVFHQLRKKFDLKEEYADCLLLCRHCRCLFWKSFGHPCIKNDDSLMDKKCPNFRLDQTRPAVGSNKAVCNCDGSNNNCQSSGTASQQNRQQAQLRSNTTSERDQIQSRISVAALSRNFDNRAHGINNQPASVVIDAAENVPPPESSVPDNQRATARYQQRRLSSQLQQLPQNGNNLLDARLREQNLRVANQILEERSNNNNNNNTVRRDHELVPKHVAISPQAFLNFFSL